MISKNRSSSSFQSEELRISFKLSNSSFRDNLSGLL
jgi:hypothetical protein